MKRSSLILVLFLLAYNAFSQTTSWTGAVDSTWHNPLNWTAGVPADTVDVVIGDANYYGTYSPAVLASANCKNLTLDSGLKLEVYTSDDIVISGSFTNNGLVVGDSTSITFDGTVASLCGTGAGVYRNFTVLPGVNVTVNKSISISGNLLVDGAFSSTGKTVTFVGSIPSVVKGSGTIVLGNVVQNKSNSFTRLESPVTISGNLDLNNGVIYTSSTGLLTLEDNATTSSGSDTSYVDGPMQKKGDDAFVFPLGNNGVWARFAITAPSIISDAFIAQYYANGYANTDSLSISSPAMINVSKVEYWSCERSAGNSSVSVSLYWEDNVRSDFSDFTSLVVASWDGSRWSNAGNSGIVPLNKGNIRSFVQNSFAAFTFGSISNENPMPIGLVNFAAKLNAVNAVELNWQTATETNNSYFTVEKSADGANYEAVAKIEGAGTTLVAHSYSYSDPNPAEGMNYYRIRQTDKNGSFTYSQVRLVEFENSRTDIELYPNPSNGSVVTVGLPADDKVSEVVVFNSMGQQVFHVISAPDQVNAQIAFSEFPHGVYTVVVIGEQHSYQKKLVVETM